MKKFYFLILLILFPIFNLVAQITVNISNNVGINNSNPNEALDVIGNPVFGTAPERLSLASGSLGFNRRVAVGSIYNPSSFAYQFQHTGSSTASSDFLALQVYNPSGANITPAALAINGNGQVGIGTTSPADFLNIFPNGPGGLVIGGNPGISGYTSLSLGISAVNNGYSYINSISSSGSSYGNLILNANGGNVGIRTTAAPEVLTLGGNIRGSINNGALQINTGNLMGSGANAYAQIGPQNGGYCHMYTNTPCFAFNQAICTMGGFIGSYNNTSLYISVGITAANPPGTIAMSITQGNAFVGMGNAIGIASYNLDLGSTGTFRVGGQSWTSDSTLKTNIKVLTGSLSSVLNLQGKTYNYKSNIKNNSTSIINANSNNINPNLTSIKSDTSAHVAKFAALDTSFTNRTHIGFLAQDVQNIYPQLVYKDKQGILSIDYIGFIPILTEAIKEQNTTITTLQTANTGLQATVTKLQTSNTTLQSQITSLQTTITSLQAAITALQKKVGI